MKTPAIKAAGLWLHLVFIFHVHLRHGCKHACGDGAADE
jgi:hypothetical protein